MLEWMYNHRLVRKVFEEMTFEKISDERRRELHLEWMNVPGKGQSKCDRPEERACRMCSRNSKGIKEAEVEWDIGEEARHLLRKAL